ncbi:hypothetical protein AAFF_G00362310 [Aldrovandia affinis]|uniref:Uncharacterized protein n=1 Tax=Aldrovandia affinis TaxID=143900 RepID=A0AAD7SHY2_9TELE|nr:hypothetical protein AAFF_G00362310 [Aldrovandia affinis]
MFLLLCMMIFPAHSQWLGLVIMLLKMYYETHTANNCFHSSKATLNVFELTRNRDWRTTTIFPKLQQQTLTVLQQLTNASSLESEDELSQKKNQYCGGNENATRNDWPDLWTVKQGEEFKSKNPWLGCKNKRLGCLVCSHVNSL